MSFISQEEANQFFEQISKQPGVDIFLAPAMLCDNFGIDKRAAHNLFLNWVDMKKGKTGNG